MLGNAGRAGSVTNDSDALGSDGAAPWLAALGSAPTERPSQQPLRTCGAASSCAIESTDRSQHDEAIVRSIGTHQR
jgi:hypothetical protein